MCKLEGEWCPGLILLISKSYSPTYFYRTIGSLNYRNLGEHEPMRNARTLSQRNLNCRKDCRSGCSTFIVNCEFCCYNGIVIMTTLSTDQQVPAIPFLGGNRRTTHRSLRYESARAQNGRAGKQQARQREVTGARSTEGLRCITREIRSTQ